MWVLRLNDMRDPHVEMMTDVAYSQTKEALKEFVSREAVEPYRDRQWGKVFRQGGPLEWFNPPMFGEESYVQLPTEDEYVEKMRQNYRNHFSSLMKV